jgi:hypothetical protein
MNEAPKTSNRRIYPLSFLLSLGAIVVLPYLADYVGANTLAAALQLLWLPGLILASIVFPGGIHSIGPDKMDLYLGLSLVLSVFVWMWPTIFSLKLVRKRRARTSVDDS